MHDPEFANRQEAGRLLAAALDSTRGARPLVLALPRGGVPVAYEVAQALDAELDLLIVRKIGAPDQEELGIGAVVDGADPQVVLNDDIIRIVGASDAYVRAETQRQLAEIERRRRAYRGEAPPPSTKGRTVIVVDDGVATGGTVIAALRALRKTGPARILLAVPVAPRATVTALEQECDALVCLAQPDPFYAVGTHYRDFDQTSDREVIELLRKAEGFGRAPGARTG